MLANSAEQKLALAAINPVSKPSGADAGAGDHKNAPAHDYVSKLKRYTGINPFVSRTQKITCYEGFKIAIMTLTMIPLIKLILIITCLFIQYLFACLITCCCFDPKKPITGFRFIWTYPIRFLMRVILLIGGFYWISVTDHRPADVPHKANIYVLNHISMWDMFALIYRHGVSGAGKAEIFDFPLIGRILRALQCVPVGRETGDGRRLALEAIVTRAKNPGGLYPPLVIFPQGTTTNDNVITMFKKGAFAPREAVQPILLRYPNRHFDLYLDSSALGCLWRSLCQFMNFISLEYLPEYHPSPAEVADDVLYANNVRALMATKLDVPVTDHDFNDLRLAVEASRAHLKVDFVLNDVQENFHSKYDDVKLLMKVFRQFDRKKQGSIALEDFTSAIGLKPGHDTAKRLFALFDTDESGSIEFGEFVVAMSIASKNCTPLDSAKILFEVCDLDGDRKVTRDELTRVLSLARGVHAPLADATPAAIIVPVTPLAAAIDGPNGAAGTNSRAAAVDMKIDIRPSTPSAAAVPSSAAASPAAAGAGAAVRTFDPLLDADVFRVLFPNAGESDLGFDEFVKRLTAPGAERTARALLNLFLWKRMAPLAPAPDATAASPASH